MDRLKRALAYTVLVTGVYNILCAIAAHIRAPALSGALALVQYGHGFALGISAGCLATGETAMLGIVALSILLVEWPTDLIALTIATVTGGTIGLLIRRLVREHREPIHRPDSA